MKNELVNSFPLTSSQQRKILWMEFKVCGRTAVSKSKTKSGAIWHISVPKRHREVQIIARFETPPLLLVCKHGTTEIGQGGGASRVLNTGRNSTARGPGGGGTELGGRRSGRGKEVEGVLINQ